MLGMGLVLGAIGGGGGILTVPILVGLFGMAATQATGSSLFVVGAASAAGAAVGIARRESDVKSALALAAPSAVGAFTARAFVVPQIPTVVLGISRDKLLLWAFAILMVVVGVKMLQGAVSAGAPDKKAEGAGPQEDAAASKQAPPAGPSAWAVAGIGLAIGLVSGVLGAGGGFLIVPALTLLLGIDLKRAIPTSLLVIAVQSLIGFAGELGRPIPWAILITTVCVALAGLAAGLAVREKAPKKALQAAFAVLVFAVAAWMVLH